MTDADIVYDADTGAPLSEGDVADLMENGVQSSGLSDFHAKMKKAASDQA